jgi:hypothetical protein
LIVKGAGGHLCRQIEREAAKTSAADGNVVDAVLFEQRAARPE